MCSLQLLVHWPNQCAFDGNLRCVFYRRLTQRYRISWTGVLRCVLTNFMTELCISYFGGTRGPGWVPVGASRFWGTNFFSWEKDNYCLIIVIIIMTLRGIFGQRVGLIYWVGECFFFEFLIFRKKIFAWAKDNKMF